MPDALERPHGSDRLPGGAPHPAALGYDQIFGTAECVTGGLDFFRSSLLRLAGPHRAFKIRFGPARSSAIRGSLNTVPSD
jgi:hypothetical protein